MYQIRNYGYNGNFFCVTVVPTIEDCKQLIGETLWNMRKEDSKGNIEIDYCNAGEKFWNDFYDSDKEKPFEDSSIPCFGQCWNEMNLTIIPFEFGKIVSSWDDD